jgi:hypothetical protein
LDNIIIIKVLLLSLQSGLYGTAKFQRKTLAIGVLLHLCTDLVGQCKLPITAEDVQESLRIYLQSLKSI